MLKKKKIKKKHDPIAIVFVDIYAVCCFFIAFVP